jgi:endoglucanase Acf2
MMRTKRMELTLKHPLPPTGILIDSYNSPIQDEKFYENFVDPANTKVDAQIQYIFIGNLLNKRGTEIM